MRKGRRGAAAALRVVTAACAAVLVGASPAVAQQPAPLTVGETFTLESRVLGEVRRINVYLPPDYAAADTVRLPVLYMPDGGIQEDFLHVAGLVQIGALNGTMRPHILVGIENTERRRDLTPPTADPENRAIAPRVGGSAAFRAFLRDELLPAIDSLYRTTAERALVGESLAGLFVVETLLLEPELFDGWIAVDPSLWWDGGRLIGEATRAAAGGRLARERVFLASSGEVELAEGAEGLAAALRGVDGGPTVHLLPLPMEAHHTVYHPAAMAAFRALLAPPPGT